MKALLASRTVASALALAGALVAPSFAGATTCAKWDVSQPWVALQTNGYRVEFHLNQQRPDFQGTATFSDPEKRGAFSGAFGTRINGRVSGTLEGDSIEINGDWGGVYRGSIDASGRIVGTTHDKSNPAARSRANWSSDRRMNCLARKAPVVGSNDFNGDGSSDILWHNGSTGESQVWLMNGSSRIGRATLTDGARPTFIGPPWRIVGARDFNGDRKSDVLWYNGSTGETQLWFMDGHRLQKRETVLAQDGRAILIGPPWSIVGTGDMNRDGKSDIVWHNGSTGGVQVWMMDGHRVRGRPMVLDELGGDLSVGPPRRIVGVNDLNDDERPDLVLHNSVTGTTQVFFMNGLKVERRPAVIAENRSPIAVGPPWRIAGSNDFNRDGMADLLWHNGATGETQIWFMRADTIIGRASVDAVHDGGGALVGAPWRIVNQ